MIGTAIWILGTFIWLICVGYYNIKNPNKKSDMDYLVAVFWPVFICLMVATYIFRAPVKIGEMLASRKT